ncbi:MAG: hypothetical protein JWO02_640 [Solirubrobacterales bacterium]|nr:hypothetical protein [Solirubrobacterales bacterium]
MFGTQTEIAALVLTVVVHLIGAGALIWGMIDHDDPDRGSWRDWWPRDYRDDEPPADPEPKPSGGTAVPVLPQSAAPGVRVREGGRIGDLTPRRDRRPAHQPQPAPVHEPARAPD